MSVSDDLDAAADYIEQHGWVQGTFCDDDTGAVCALGSINRTTNHQWRRAISVANSLREFTGIHNVVEWNDQPNRTADEVIQAMRDTAIKNRDDAV